VNFSELLKQLNSDSIQFYVEGEKLLLELPSDDYSINEGLLAAIKDHKQQLIGLCKRKTNQYVDNNAIASVPNDGSPIPLSYAQRGLWFINQYENKSETIYNTVVPMQVLASINVERLTLAVKKIVKRHEVLRTSFNEIDSIPTQIIHDDLAIEINVVSADEFTLEALIERENNHTFDLQTGPLIRFNLLQENAESHVLVLNCHHIIFDGVSLRVLLKELNAYYCQSSQELPALALQFRDFAHWQEQWLNSAQATEQIQYWKDVLSGAPRLLNLPTDRPRPATPSKQGSQIVLDIPQTTVDTLNDLCSTLNLTPYMVYLSALNVALGICSGQRDMVIGTSVANRSHKSLEPLIGYFVNTLAIRLRFSDEESVEQTLLAAKKAILEAFDHQDLPFDKLVDVINPERNISHSPIYQVLFVMQNMAMADFQLGDAKVTLLDSVVNTNTSRFDLFIEVVENIDGVKLRCEFSRDLFDTDTVTKMMSQYIQLLSLLGEDVKQPVSSLIELSDESQHRVGLQFHHVGIACDDIDESTKWVDKFFSIDKRSGVVWDELQSANLSMLETNDGLRIELVQGPQVSNLVKRGVHFYHICYATPNIDTALREFLKKGANLVVPPKPAILFGGKKVAFLETDYGLIELLEDADIVSSQALSVPSNDTKRTLASGLESTSLYFDSVGVLVNDIHQILWQLYGLHTPFGDVNSYVDNYFKGPVSYVNTLNDCALMCLEKPKKHWGSATGSHFSHLSFMVKDISQLLPELLQNHCVLIRPAEPISQQDSRLRLVLETPLGVVMLTEVEELEATAQRIDILGSQIIVQKPISVVVSGTFTVDPILPTLQFWSDFVALPTDITIAPYNQVFQELLNPTSATASNTDNNILLVCFDDWLGRDHDVEKLKEFNEIVAEFLLALEHALANSSAHFLLLLCANKEAMFDDVRQAYSSAQQNIANVVNERANLTLLVSEDIEQLYSVRDIYDDHTNKSGHIPYKNDYYVAAGSALFRSLYMKKQPPYKVIVLDCDNTLWSGVCGELGPLAMGVGSGYKYLQEFVLECHAKGFLLCLCSRNEPEDVWAVFEENDAMVLTRDHIVTAKINWEAKSSNIKAIADELNLGLDSFIFIDDDSVQCAEVRANCPSVTTLQLPEKEQDIANFLDQVWAFDASNQNKASIDRTEQYRQQHQRQLAKKAAPTLDDFIESLALEITIKQVQMADYERVVELLLRTNQFNFMGRRLDHDALTAWFDNDQHQAAMVSVKDRFGDYGQVGLMLFNPQQDCLELTDFVLSCRSLGREVEYAMLQYLAKEAQKMSLNTVLLSFKKSPKNRPAYDFLKYVSPEMPPKEGLAEIHVIKIDVANLLTIQGPKEENVSVAQGDSNEEQTLSTNMHSLVFQRVASELSDLPLLCNQVSDMEADHESEHAVYESAINQTEKQLLEFWSSLLKIPENKIGRQDNFFDLGGNSFLATQLTSRIYQEFNLNVSLKQLFERPILGDLGKLIDALSMLDVGVMQHEDNSNNKNESDLEEFIL